MAESHGHSAQNNNYIYVPAELPNPNQHNYSRIATILHFQPQLK